MLLLVQVWLVLTVAAALLLILVITAQRLAHAVSRAFSALRDHAAASHRTAPQGG